MLAADNDCTHLAELLVKYGADVKAFNKDSKTAIEIACHKGLGLQLLSFIIYHIIIIS